MPKVTSIQGEESRPKFDSLAWREARNKKLVEWVRDPDAIKFLIMLGETSEFFDDLIDKDKPISDNDIVRMLFITMIDMQVNPFLMRHKAELIPLMSMSIHAWLDANTLERQGDNDKNRAYVLRDMTIEVCLYVIGIVRGRDYLRENSFEVRKFFLHETLEEYKGKLS